MNTSANTDADAGKARLLAEFAAAARRSDFDRRIPPPEINYNCGLGRLAMAFSNFFGKEPSRHYFGYEIHPAAFTFFREAYQDFQHHVHR